MKHLTTAAVFFILLNSQFLHAQQVSIPLGFVKAKITLQNGQTLQGNIKEDIKKRAAILFMDNADAKKTLYNGDQISSIVFDEQQFICIKGDFFKLIVAGEYSFLQKLSNAAEKPVYIGTEAMFINGSEGKIGSYYLYNMASKTLQLLTKNNMETIANNAFASCQAAIAKAKSINQNISQLQDVVTIYNNRNSK